jgi:hypothetical protein
MTVREFVGYRYSHLRNNVFVAKATMPVSERCSRVRGKDAGIRSTFKLYDLKGLTSPAGEISHVSFYDLGRAFVDFRLREHRNPDPYTSPPSGVWRVSECRTD